MVVDLVDRGATAWTVANVGAALSRLVEDSGLRDGGSPGVATSFRLASVSAPPWF